MKKNIKRFENFNDVDYNQEEHTSSGNSLNINLELTSSGTIEDVIDSLKSIIGGLEDAKESESPNAILDGVDEDVWDIENTKFNISI